MICRDLPGRPNVIRRVLQVPTVKRLNHAQKKNVFRNDSPEGATDNSGMITGEFKILSVELFRLLSDFLIVFSFYSENGVSIPYAVYGIRSQAHLAVLG